MKRYQLFLAYYTLITSTSLFIWSLIFASKPQGFFLTLLIIPISLYFWLIVLGIFKPQPAKSLFINQIGEEGSKWPLIILMTLFISSFSLLVYSIISSRSPGSESVLLPAVSKEISSLRQEIEKLSPDKESSANAKLAEELKAVKSKLTDLQSGQKRIEEASFSAEEASPGGTLTIKDKKNSTVNVYERKSLTSKIIGKAEFGKTYIFIEKYPDWYLVLLADVQKNQNSGGQGFISSQFVKEVEY